MSEQVASIVNCDNVKEADVVLVSANYDTTSSFGKGADKGPAAILQCLHRQIELHDRWTGMLPIESLRIAHCDPGNLNHLSPDEMIAEVRKYCAPLFRSGKLVIVLGGEHSVTTGSAQALAAYVRHPQEVNVLQIDAHLDLRDDDSDYTDEPHGRYAHSCVMRRVHELHFPTVHVGIRAYSAEEYAYAKEHRLRVFEWGGRRRKTPAPTDILRALKYQQTYITVDVDGIDPAHMPATGTPVQGGLEWYYTFDLLRLVFQKKTVLGFDVVEVAPRPHDTLTEYGAAQLCYTMIAFWARSKSKKGSQES